MCVRRGVCVLGGVGVSWMMRRSSSSISWYEKRGERVVGVVGVSRGERVVGVVGVSRGWWELVGGGGS